MRVKFTSVPAAKVLEVRVKQAHLLLCGVCRNLLDNLLESVRELFTKRVIVLFSVAVIHNIHAS